MGTVYRATDESLGRDVAIKLVRRCQADAPESRERLRREACAAGRLNHPRVAQVYALNFSNGHPYLVMELVTGQDFAQMLEREGPIGERAALKMALDVADGLSALNREGLVHGDIKPGNIVLDRDGNAKLVDFGLSGMTRNDGSGAIAGTPDYIAPELLRGEKDSHRSDLYCLGATLYHLLSGRLPHDGEKTSDDVLKARLFKHPIPLGTHCRNVSLPTRKLVMRMLETIPGKRHPNSEAVAADIREALARLDTPTPAAPGVSGLVRRFLVRLGLPPRPEAPAPVSRRPAGVALLLGLAVLLVLLITAKPAPFACSREWLLRQVGSPFAAEVPPMTQKTARPETVAPVQDVAGHIAALTLPASRHQPENAIHVRDVLTSEAHPVWQSANLGEHTQGGSTLQMGETMIVQGAGTDMWDGERNGRFVWTKVTGSYAFSAQIRKIADNDRLAITGLLVNGTDPALGPCLLFGFLGSGELFLQIRRPNTAVAKRFWQPTRQPNSTVEVVKRSAKPIRLPSYLKLVRCGNAFETFVSADGHSWDPFAACELDLPSGNTIGFAVSAQVPDTLATANFASIRLLVPSLLTAAQTNAVPAVISK